VNAWLPRLAADVEDFRVVARVVAALLVAACIDELSTLLAHLESEGL